MGFHCLERDIPVGKAVLVILDNYAAHRTRKVRRWDLLLHTDIDVLAQCSGRHLAKLTWRRLEHCVFHSVCDLQAVINRFVATRL